MSRLVTWGLRAPPKPPYVRNRPPLASFADEVLLVIRLIMGVTMVYYGWPKIRDPKKNAVACDLLLLALALALLAFGPGRYAVA